jgi:fructose-1,6-bisphosphatase/inositol monophosphatase family enzyme
VATGRADVMIDPIMSLWDAAPLLTIITEAGGRFSDWQGTPTIYSEEDIATNEFLHEEIIAITRQFPKIPL